MPHTDVLISKSRAVGFPLVFPPSGSDGFPPLGFSPEKAPKSCPSVTWPALCFVSGRQMQSETHMIYVAIMTVRRNRLIDLGAYEQGAAAVAARHGGTITKLDNLRPELVTDVTTKIRMLRFPSDDAFRAYTKDPDLAALDPLRDRAITRMDVYVGNPSAEQQRSSNVKVRAAR